MRKKRKETASNEAMSLAERLENARRAQIRAFYAPGIHQRLLHHKAEVERLEGQVAALEAESRRGDLTGRECIKLQARLKALKSALADEYLAIKHLERELDSMH